MNAANGLLLLIMNKLEEMGVGSDEPIDGGDAVEFLNELRDDLKAFLKR